MPIGAVGALLLAVACCWAGAALAQSFTSAAAERVTAVRSLAQPRAVVLKSRRVLHLFDGAVLVRCYPVALGPTPRGQKIRDGDGCTPEGRFRVCAKNRDSRYHRFIGIDYPDLPAAERGRDSGLITQGELATIRGCLAAGRCPPWNTALGGGIGIHGRGRDGAAATGDWTAGCIALSDEHAQELFDVLRIGDTVEILP